MRFKTDEQLLKELQTLPDIRMNPEKKQEIVNAIRSADASKAEQPVVRRFTILGKGLAICSVLAATIWMGTSLVNPHQPTEIPDPISKTPAAQNPNHGSVTAPVPKSDELLRTIRKQAEKGSVINAPYMVEKTVSDTVEKDWGAPDRTHYANGLTYFSYDKHGIVLGYNKGMQLVDIRSLDPRIQSISLSQVEKEYGKPNRVSEFDGQTIYTYDVTDKYQIKFVFQGSIGAGSDLRAIHYNVYYPQGSKNLMRDLPPTELLQSIRDLAKNGQTLGSDFRVEKDVFDTVEKQWGKPDTVSNVKGIMYNTYRDRGMVIAFNKGMQLVDIRSYDPQLQFITATDVEKTLGKPQAITTTRTETIYTYKVNDKYELKIVFSGIAGPGQKTLYIDHVNVYYPRGTINNMAG